MGEQLVLELSDDWHPERYRDEFRAKLEALVEAKRRAGDVRQAPGLEKDIEAPATADVIDLTELLRRSLKRAAPPPAPSSAAGARKPAAAAKRAATARKAANDDAREQRAVAAAKPAATARASVKPRAGPTKPPRSRAG